MTVLWRGSKIIQIIIAGVAILAIATAFYTIPTEYDSEAVSPLDHPVQRLIVSKQEPLHITVENSDKQIKGIVLYAGNDESAHVRFEVRVTDTKGQALFRSWQRPTIYPQSGAPALSFLFSNNRYAVPKKMDITILLKSSEPGVLIANTKGPVFSLLYEKPVSSGTKQGALVGAALALALLILYTMKSLAVSTQWITAAAMIFLAAFLVTLPYIYRPNGAGIDDWDYRYSLAHIYTKTITVFHQFPFWNPYICGGTAALGDPEFSLFTPMFLLQFLYGVEAGTGYALTLGFIITGLGVLVLARKLRLDPFSALVSAIIILFSSALMLKATEGQETIIFAYMWVPWVFWAWLKGKSFVCGIFLTFMLLAGGIYILSYTALALVVLTILRKNKPRALYVSVCAGLWMIGLSSFQLIPTLYWLKEFPDTAFVGSAYTYNGLSHIFFGRYSERSFVLQNQVSFWHEYGAYIGYGACALILLGASYAGSSKIVRVLILGLICTLICSAIGPLFAPILAHFPFLPRSNISRLILFSLLCGGLLAGFGMKRIISLRTRTFLLPVIFAGFICIDLFSLSYVIAEQGFSVHPVSDRIPPAMYPIEYTTDMHPARQQGIDIPRSYAAIEQGYGTFSFCSVIGPSSAVVLPTEKNLKPPYMTSGRDVSVKLISWSPNTIALSYAATSDADIVLNSNYARGWHSDYGYVEPTARLLTLRVPAGERVVTLRYRPPGLGFGIFVTGVTIVIFMSRIFPYCKRNKGDDPGKILRK